MALSMDLRVAPKPLGDDMRSHRIEERADGIFAISQAGKDITLGELVQALAETGLAVSVVSLHRFFVHRDMTRKRRMASPVCKGDFEVR